MTAAPDPRGATEAALSAPPEAPGVIPLHESHEHTEAAGGAIGGAGEVALAAVLVLAAVLCLAYLIRRYADRGGPESDPDPDPDTSP